MESEHAEKTFKEWIQLHRGLLFKVVLAYTFTKEDQEDLFQEICMQIWKSVPAFRQQAKVSTWIYRIALNTALTRKRSDKRTEKHREYVKQELLVMNNQHTDHRITWLYETIAKLNHVDRSITLLLLDGYNYKEMSEILGISASNIGVKIHRIKKQLKELSKQIHHAI